MVVENDMKKKTIAMIIFIIFGCSMNVWAGGQPEIYQYRDGIALARTNDEWLIINDKGKTLLSLTKLNVGPVFSSWGFYEDLMAVQSGNGKIGFIDKSGNIVIRPQYIGAKQFSGGIAAVQIPSTIPGMPGKWGFIRKNGEFAILPMYDDVISFSEKRAFVRKNVPQGDSIYKELWFLIDETGKFINDKSFEIARGFSEGLAAVRVNLQWGFIDIEGNWKIQPEYGPAYSFSEGFAGVGKNGWNFIDKNGNIVFEDVTEILPQEYTLQFREGWAVIPELAGDNFKYGYINIDGIRKISPVYDVATSFSEGAATVYMDKGDGQGRQAGVIDQEGDWIIQPGTFESIGPFSEGKAIVRKDGKLGCINTKGEILFWSAAGIPGIARLPGEM